MNTIKKYLLLLYLVVMGNNLAHGNKIPNSSFESGDALFPNSPNAISQLERTQDWKEFESSDWISDTDGLLNGYYDPNNSTYQGGPNGNKLFAHSGNNFIGFGSCEGAQVKLTSKTGKMK